MAADPKAELHALVDRLSVAQARDTLAYAQERQRRREPSEQPEPAHNVPTLHRAPAIATIDDLVVPLFSPEESADEFEATIRRWREIPESA